MNKLLVSGIIVLVSFLLLININKPFIGQHDWNGVVYGQQAKNFVRFGYFPLKFGATLATSDTPAKERKFSTHYTPILPILISFSYRLFGVSEWSTRLVPVLSSLSSVFLVILLGKDLISFRGGIIAGILMAVTPMFIYYGNNPVHEVVLLPFVLLSFYSYQRFRKTGKESWWKILLLASAAAMLVGWPGYYAAGLIFLHGILYQPKEKMRFLQLPLITAVLLTIFFFHSIILSSQAAGDLQNIFLARLGGSSIGLIAFLTKELRYSINLFTVTLLFLSSIWLIGHSKNKSVLLLLGLFGLTHILIFRQAGYYHEYLLFPLLPFLTISGSAAIDKLIGYCPPVSQKVVVAALIILMVGTERLGYLQALLNSEYIRPVWEDALRFKSGKQLLFPQSVNENRIYFDFYAD